MWSVGGALSRPEHDEIKSYPMMLEFSTLKQASSNSTLRMASNALEDVVKIAIFLNPKGGVHDGINY